MRTPLILLGLFIFNGCATLTGQAYLHCGNVGALSVSVQDGYILDCKELMSLSSNALHSLNTRNINIQENWNVTFVWSSIDIGNPRAQTDFSSHNIKIRSANGIHHELMHAYLDGIGTFSHQHTYMCKHGWDKYDRDFGVNTNYCGITSED